jgi:hypothetical protein
MNPLSKDEIHIVSESLVVLLTYPHPHPKENFELTKVKFYTSFQSELATSDYTLSCNVCNFTRSFCLFHLYGIFFENKDIKEKHLFANSHLLPSSYLWRVQILLYLHYTKMHRYHPYSRYRGRKQSINVSAGHHAPHINLTHANDDIQIELKKVIRSGEQRSLLITPEKFFEIANGSDDIQQAGKAIAGNCFINYLNLNCS